MIGTVSAASDTNDTLSSDVSNEVVTHTDIDKTNSNNNEKINEDTKTDEKSSTNNLQSEKDTWKISATKNNENILKENDETTSFKSLNKTIYDNINKGTYTIDLKSNYTYQTNDGEDLKKGITIDGTKLQGQTLTINGNAYTINGSNEARIFKVTNGAQLKLINITLTQGKGQNDGQYGGNVGGAIYNNGKLTIINCTFNNNTAWAGGAIYASSGSTVNINNTTFTQNNATYGGAIYATYSTVNINNTTFTQNTAREWGGAIYTYSSTVNINNTTFTQNNAKNGGAIYADSSTVNINNTTFTQNNADWYGGAICNYGTVIIMGSELTDNTATSYGGAIYNQADTLTLVDSNLQNDGLYIDSSVGSGVVPIGGYIAFVTTQVFDISVLPAVDVDLVEIQLSGRGYSGEVWVNVTNSTFNQIVKVNLKDGEGSGTINLPIGNKYNATINTIQGHSINPQTQEFSTIHETSFTALYNNITNSQDDTLTLTHDYTYDNRTDRDLITGIPINKTITINGNGYSIDGNNTARIFQITNQAKVTINNITLTQGQGQNINIGGGEYNVGGAIYATDNCNITITDSKITHNNAEHYGGAIFAWNSQINITHTNITQNNAIWGGAIYAYGNSQININNTNITQNNANKGHGGAIYATSNSQININNTNITQNNAYVGGAIYTVDNSQININNTNITQNNANDGGGAIFAYNSQVNMSYTSFIKNTAKGTDTYDGGGAIYASYNSTMAVSSSLFMNNTASKNGGAIYGGNFKNLTVNNNIFLNNSGNKEIYLYKNSNVDFEYDLGCNWFGNNATDYMNKPDTVQLNDTSSTPKELVFDNWLFLNASSTVNPIIASSVSDIVFKLYWFNETGDDGVSDVDNSLFYPVNLTVTPINGSVDKNCVSLNESFEYTAYTGESSVTASIADAKYIINANKYSTQFTIQNISDFNEGSSIDLIVNEKNKYTGQVTVTIGTETYNIDIINGAGKLTITPKLAPGTYNAKIKFAGNENYTEANASSNSFKINAKPVPPSPEPVTKQNTNIVAKNKVYKLAKYKTYTVTVKNKKGKPVKNTKVQLKIGKKTYTAKTNKKGVATFKIPNKKSKKKTNKKSYKITATLNKNAKNDKLILKRGSKTNKATTNKNGVATFKIKKTTKKIRKYTITLKTTTGQAVNKQKINLKVKGKTFKAKTNSKGKATFKINNLNKNGKYKAKINYKGNNNYNKSNKTVKLTVKE